MADTNTPLTDQEFASLQRSAQLSFAYNGTGLNILRLVNECATCRARPPAVVTDEADAAAEIENLRAKLADQEPKIPPTSGWIAAAFWELRGYIGYAEKFATDQDKQRYTLDELMEASDVGISYSMAKKLLAALDIHHRQEVRIDELETALAERDAKISAMEAMLRPETLASILETELLRAARRARAIVEGSE